MVNEPYDKARDEAESRRDTAEGCLGKEEEKKSGLVGYRWNLLFEVFFGDRDIVVKHDKELISHVVKRICKTLVTKPLFLEVPNTLLPISQNDLQL